MSRMAISRLPILAAFLIAAACSGGDTTATLSATSLTITPSAAVWCPPYGIAEYYLIGWNVCYEREHEYFEIFERDTPGVDLGSTPDQTVPLTDFEPIGVSLSSTADENGDGDGALLYVFGLQKVTGRSEIWMFGKGTSPDLVDAQRLGTVQLPVDQLAVAMHQQDADTWWVATTNEDGDLRVYGGTDTDDDDLLDTLTLFADLAALSTGWPTALSKLEQAPFKIRQGESSDEVILWQDHHTKLRLVDSNDDGTADRALLPRLHNRAGSTVTAGADPGSNRVAVAAPPSTALEIWKMDSTDTPVTLLASGRSATNGRVVLTLSQSLAAADRLAVKNIDDDVFGAVAVVEVTDFPTLVPLGSVRIDLGGEINFYIPGTTAANVTATWNFTDKNDYPERIDSVLTVTASGNDEYKIEFPAAETRHMAGQQLLVVEVIGLANDAVLDVRVEPSGP